MKNYTYGMLKEDMFGKELSQKEKNIRSGLNSFTKFYKRSDSDLVINDLEISYTALLEKWLLSIPQKQRRSKKCFAQKIYQFFHERFSINFVVGDVGDLALADYLSRELEAKGMSIKDFEKIFGFTASRWITEKAVPSYKTRNLLGRVSEFFGHDKSFLYRTYFQEPSFKVGDFSVGEDEFSIYMKNASKNGYCIAKDEWGNSDAFKKIRDDFELYKKYKTSLVINPKIQRGKKKKWMKRKNNVCNSAIFAIGKLCSFFGYLKKYRSYKEFSLMMLFDMDLFTDYLNFFLERRGFPTKTLLEFYNAVISLGRYYIQYPHLLEGHYSLDEFKEIVECLHSARSEYEYEKGKNTEWKLNPFLDLEDPLVPFFEMIKMMKLKYKFIEKQGESKRLDVLGRDIVVTSLLLRKPLRPANWREAELGTHLRLEVDGRWSLNFEAKEVKNNKLIFKVLNKEESYWVSLYVNPEFFTNISIK